MINYICDKCDKKIDGDCFFILNIQPPPISFSDNDRFHFCEPCIKKLKTYLKEKI
jgi:hypothetical protein